jgi:hypothetical protein
MSTPLAATTVNQDEALEGDVEPAMEDPTMIRETTGTPTASPRHITPISVSTSPSPATNRHRETSEDDTCYHCSESGPKSPGCPIKRRGEAAQEKAKCARTSSVSANFTSASKEASDSPGY